MATVLAEPTTDRVAAPPAAGRWVNLDAARLLAAYAVVWIHALRSPELERAKALGRFAVPFFVLAAVLLAWESGRRASARSMTEYAWSRLGRIYVPFLAWSGIYLLLKLGKGAAMPEMPNDYRGWSILWQGSFYHLWFMPLVLVATLAAFAAGRVVRRRAPWGPPLAALCTAVAVCLAVLPECGVSLAESDYGKLVAGAAPSVFAGIALAVLLGAPAGKRLKEARATPWAGVLAVAATGWMWRYGASPAAETLAGLGVLLVALGPWRAAWCERLARWAPLAYGIYLAHLVPIKVLEALAARAALPVDWRCDLAIFAIAAACTTAAVWALCRGRWTRWLV
jgi:peptidoglycan/LPS O-acetylase OafA/YrhL